MNEQVKNIIMFQDCFFGTTILHHLQIIMHIFMYWLHIYLLEGRMED